MAMPLPDTHGADATTPIAPPLPLVGVTLAGLAARHGLTLLGPDRPVRFLARIKQRRDQVTDVLTYVTSRAYLEAFLATGHEACILERRFLGADLPADRSWLICDGMADDAFFSIHVDLVVNDFASFVSAGVGAGTLVHPAASIADHVRIGRDCRIDAGAVLYANTVLGDRVHIKSNANVGGEGFEAKYVGGRRIIVPHTGGVFVGDDCLIGSATCVDRGLFGTFTVIEHGTKVDNLVHVAHNVTIGPDAGIVACAEISGSSTIGRGAWFGPRACCNHEVAIGDYAFIGTGSVVTADVPAHALAFGSPAKLRGWACRCRNKVVLADGAAVCDKCGTRLAQDADGRVHIVAS